MARSDLYQALTGGGLGRLLEARAEPDRASAAQLREELDATLLFCHALYEHLRRKGLLEEAEFAALFDELDLADGRRDRRAADRPLPGTEGDGGGD